MIATCTNCLARFNDQTSEHCPICVRPKKKKKTKKKGYNYQDIHFFMRNELHEKRRTASGARHRQKTGGN